MKYFWHKPAMKKYDMILSNILVLFSEVSTHSKRLSDVFTPTVYIDISFSTQNLTYLIRSKQSTWIQLKHFPPRFIPTERISPQQFRLLLLGTLHHISGYQLNSLHLSTNWLQKKFGNKTNKHQLYSQNSKLNFFIVRVFCKLQSCRKAFLLSSVSLWSQNL